jgi:hypothetical protein
MSNCFTTVFPALADRIAERLPGVWVDLDQDQLQPDNAALDYPLPYDVGVVLVSFDEVEWFDQAGGLQEGNAVIRFTLARQVVQDTYTFTGQHGGQRAAAMQQLQQLSLLHQALQHFAADGQQGFGALVRTYSRKEEFSQPGLWVYSLGYKCRLYDAEGYQLHPVAFNVEAAPRPVPSINRSAHYNQIPVLP